MTTTPTTLHDTLRAELDRRLAVARAAEPLNWSAFGVRTGTPSPNDSAWISFLLAHDPADAIRRYVGELEVLERHAPCACDLAAEHPHCRTHRCPASEGHLCAEIRSLASRLGVS